ncbi:Werner Syndrome-like exonuclease [Senna tora]|uniref:Werner Syndrome-like exonuclease n=1 Tax=Senna tora TaxID=362788 RepID=A0A834X4I6_9FABA|nr:Werner Syndrome-like exonuclease [Senna tora]
MEITFNPNTYKYTVNHNGKSVETTVTEKSDVADQWVDKYRKNKGKATVVGIASKFKSDKALTLQLYMDEKCLILQLFSLDSFPNSLRNFLRDPMFIFAGCEVEKLNCYFWNKYCFRASKTLDIVEAARMRWPRKSFNAKDLKVLVSQVLDMHIDLPQHVLLSNWEARMLCLEQVGCAYMEAFASYCVGHKLLIDQWATKYCKNHGKDTVVGLASLNFDRPSYVLNSNWETTMLCLEQVEFATMEAFASYCVGHKLLIGV